MGVGGQSSSANFPSWLKPYLKQALGESQRLYQDPANARPPGQDTATLQALSQREQMARAGSPVAQNAAAESARTLGGAYLSPDSNPWLAQVADRAANEASNAIGTRFAGAGRVGSGAYAAGLADAQMGTRAAIYGQNYQQERDRQQAAMQTAPAAYGLSYADTGMLGDVGASREMEAQRQFDWPYELLNRYTNTIYGNPASQTPGTKSKKELGWLDIVGGIGGALSPQMGGGS